MIHTDGSWFKDKHGRTLLLRGVNLGANSKLPRVPNGETHLTEGFFDHRNVSFVGRPFPLKKAEEHFARLRAWGYTFVRFQVTWEAIEHAGPGMYDEAYLDYVRAVLEKAAEYDINVFIDPHQDAWSRFSGGSGAPGWTFEKVGLDLTKFEETGAATVHQLHGDPFPRMVWLTNYGKLAAATMFTLFFGGNDFAPRTLVAGEPVQGYLQRHYIAAVKQVAIRLQGLPNVVGYGTMNEPSAGYIGAAAPDEVPNIEFFQGAVPTLLQTMLLGAGISQRVARWRTGVFGVWQRGEKEVNRAGVDAWLDGFDPIWQQHGVWEQDERGQARMLRPRYFRHVLREGHERKVDFYRDYFRPFANRFAAEIREVDPDALLFVEGLPGDPELSWTEDDAPDIVHAGHWYDATTLVTKRFFSWLSYDIQKSRLVLGSANVKKLFTEQLRQIREVSETRMNNAPTLIGEVGIPFDLDRRAFETGNFTKQERALTASLDALDANLLSYTLWNYNSDNTNLYGDGWNGEDLSIYSRDQVRGTGDLYDGGRALRAALRPYPKATAGEPLELRFHNQTFHFRFRHDPDTTAPTEIYLPRLQYPDGCEVTVSDGRFEIDWETQTLSYYHDAENAVHTIEVQAKALL